MKKLMLGFLFAALVVCSVNARDVPNGGESLYELSSPTALTGGSSVTGGALFNAGPEALIVNPALISKEQRVRLNLADTFLFSVNGANTVKTGDAFQLGIIVPFKMFILGGYVNGSFINLDELPLGNSTSIKVALGKDITEKLSVGAGLNTSFAWLPGFDWGLSANLGFVYHYGNLGFLKDFRFGASILNLGKTFGKARTTDFLGYPTFATVKIGAAGSFLKHNLAAESKNKLFDIGWSFDMTAPAFMNLIVDAGLKFCIKDMLLLGVTEKFDLMNTIRGNYNFIPSVSLSFKFSFDVQRGENDGENSLAAYMERNDWSESELSVSAGWKNLYKTAHAVSLGADLSLGMQDKDPPVIELWFGDEDEEDDDE